MNSEEIWTEKVAKYLVGKKIVAVKYMPLDEATEWGWYKRPCEIHLDDGTVITPSADDEENDGGSLATNIRNLLVIPTL